MNIEYFREFCLSLKGATESLPFDQNTLVFKVAGKMFALADIENFTFANLKCDPERAVSLREEYEGIKPGWHMSKVHWNSVYAGSDVDDRLFKELTLHSYELVFSKLSKKEKEAFLAEYGA